MTPTGDTTLADLLSHLRVRGEGGDLVVDETQGTDDTADVHVAGISEIGKSYGPLVGIRVPEYEQSYGNSGITTTEDSVTKQIGSLPTTIAEQVAEHGAATIHRDVARAYLRKYDSQLVADVEDAWSDRAA